MHIPAIRQPISPYSAPRTERAELESASQAPLENRQRPIASPTTAAEPVAMQREGADVLSKDERTYFAALFPEAGAEIKAGFAYSPSGRQQPAVTGSLFDRKG